MTLPRHVEQELAGLPPPTPASASPAPPQRLWADSHFRPETRSLDGRDGPAAGGEALTARGASMTVKCQCDHGAKLCTVNKDNANQGRHFWGCAKRTGRCGFFQWAGNAAPHSAADSATGWQRKRPDAGYSLVKGKFCSADIRQGGVGGRCWCEWRVPLLLKPDL